ncbi:hypothetical protein SAMN05444920_106463 [Nonomuraea solani]|uniref:Uncharacterized protein n=1 Tax=Nonomuraea solani TaxID=1144553 RepID=A0A1H6DW03_9ACTN|nr:hypothetical protein SAMN05444920_106463 [Nonomuraea solani]
MAIFYVGAMRAWHRVWKRLARRRVRGVALSQSPRRATLQAMAVSTC